MLLFSSSRAVSKVGEVDKSLWVGCQACAGLYQPQWSLIASICQPKAGHGKALLHHLWVNPSPRGCA